jgi:hypothetical protein
MNTSGFVYQAVQYDLEGQPVNPEEVSAALNMPEGQHLTDLLVLSHGWNNNIPEAQSLYEGWMQNARHILDGLNGSLGERTFGVLGLHWPSKRFTDQEDIPGGAAGLGSDHDLVTIQAQLENLMQSVPDETKHKLEDAQALLEHLEDEVAARHEFVSLFRDLIPNSQDNTDTVPDLNTLQPSEIVTAPSQTVRLPTVSTASGEGQAASLLDGPLAFARNILNLFTYYTMKERAGIVGQRGVNTLLSQIIRDHPTLQLHCVGHSMGARLLTTTAMNLRTINPLQPSTLTLVQGAFSHYGLAEHFEGDQNGFFRTVVSQGQQAGPILITHTKNDVAVGLAYPIASWLAGQVAAAIGDANDRFGGIGRNGALRTPEAHNEILVPLGTPYQFAKGQVYNLLADDVFTGHSDVTHDELWHAIFSAIQVAVQPGA